MQAPKTNQFMQVADIYDDLMEGIPYAFWVKYLKDLWKIRKTNPHTILDVACGTGNMSFRLAQEGRQVVGVDYSEGMIRAAKAKLPKDADNPQFMCQNATSIDFPMRFDAAISLFDSLNYITDPSDLAQCFDRVYHHLSPGGSFVFDMNTRYALSHGFFNQDNLGMGIFPRYNWTSTWDDDTSLCSIEMDFEAVTDQGVICFHETHLQRAYSQDEIESLLEKAGFQKTVVYHAFTSRRPTARTDRIYVASERP